MPITEQLLTDLHIGGHTKFIDVRTDKDKWEHHYYRVYFRRSVDGGKRSLSTSFRTGMGWDRPPTLVEVFQSLVDDVLLLTDPSDWERNIVRQVEALDDRMRAFLGEDYDAVIEEGGNR